MYLGRKRPSSPIRQAPSKRRIIAPEDLPTFSQFPSINGELPQCHHVHNMPVDMTTCFSLQQPTFDSQMFGYQQEFDGEESDEDQLTNPPTPEASPHKRAFKQDQCRSLLPADYCRPIDPRELFCTVPGRTSLLSSTTKYRVTVGELQRRLAPPECLNASLLGGILRKAKSKDGGKTLRDSLRRLGIALPAGRRKQASVTAWTALVEEEAVHMAKDFSLVCEKEFHSREIGVALTKTALAVDPDLNKRRTMLEESRKFISELISVLASDRTPLTPLMGPARPLILDHSIQTHLSHFTLMTHGFGVVAMSSVLDSMRCLIEESLRHLATQQPLFTHTHPHYPH